MVAVHDGASHSLAWIGSALGTRQIGLGVDRFGESGTIADLYELINVLPKAVIAKVQGASLGGGAGLALYVSVGSVALSSSFRTLAWASRKRLPKRTRTPPGNGAWCTSIATSSVWCRVRRSGRWLGC